VGVLRMSRPRAARAGYVLGLVAFVAGIYLTRGLGLALVVAGAVTALSFLLLFDVEEGAPVEPPPVDSPQRVFDPTL
jgi:hypothetical protein